MTLATVPLAGVFITKMIIRILKDSKMLVLTRKVNESIVIADNIKVKVCEVVGRKVRIAIDAPKNIPVYREEIFLAIQAKKQKDKPMPGQSA